MTGDDAAATDPRSVAYQPDLTGFAARLDSLRVRLRTPGMSVALVHDGAVTWTTGFGLANVEQHVPVTGTTPFHLASLTEPFAAAVLLQLAEEGVVGLDAPVSDYGAAAAASTQRAARPRCRRERRAAPAGRRRFEHPAANGT